MIAGLTVDVNSIALGVQYADTQRKPCNKSLEEIKVLVSTEEHDPWHTKPGGSRLSTVNKQAREKQHPVEDVIGHCPSSSDANVPAEKKA